MPQVSSVQKYHAPRRDDPSSLYSPRSRFQLGDEGGAWVASCDTLAEATAVASERVAALVHATAGLKRPFNCGVSIYDLRAKECEPVRWQVQPGGSLVAMECKCVPDAAFTADGRAVRTGDRVLANDGAPEGMKAYLTVDVDPRFAKALMLRMPTSECVAA